MRIDGFSSHSYPIKRKPRKSPAALEESLDDEIIEFETPVAARSQTSSSASSGTGNTLPARQQDMIFPRTMSKSVATALASYLTTAGFVDWDMEVLGLDLHI